MPLRLTELAMEKLLPKEPGKRLEEVDAATPGLTLRVSGPRNKAWNVPDMSRAGTATECPQWVKSRHSGGRAAAGRPDSKAERSSEGASERFDYCSAPSCSFWG
jgi:hypothetical protein